MENKEGRFERTGRSELLGLESRQWRKMATANRGWGGYYSTRKKCVYAVGLIAFIAVWAFLFFSMVRG